MSFSSLVFFYFQRVLLVLCSVFCFFQLQGQTASVTDGCAPLTVNFTPPNGATSFFWDFKDGATSNLASPSNTFIQSGTFIVEFKNTQNGPVVGSVTIEVKDKPVPTITSSTTSGCVPLTVSFSDNTPLSSSINVNSYSWVFEDGATASGKSISHTFTSAGNFFVSLELNTNSPSCNVTKQFNNYINASAKPDIGFTTSPNPPVACTPPLTVSFNNTSTSGVGGLSYRWDLGNGQNSTNTNPPDQTYVNEQVYPVKLVGTDANNCSDSTIRIVSVGSPSPILSFKDTLCIDERDTILNSSSGNASWDFNQMNLETHGYYLGLHPVISFETGGQKSVPLRLSAGGCFKDTVLSIYVHELVADYTSTPTYSCSYPATIDFQVSPNATQNASYEWVFDDTSTDVGQNTSKEYTHPKDSDEFYIHEERTFRTTLIVTNSFGCSAVLSKEDTVHSPTALMMPSVVRGCVPLQVTFSDSSLSNEKDSLVLWEWFYGDGNSFTSAEDTAVTHDYTSTGEFLAYLVVTNSSGCTDTSYQTRIRVGEPITPNFVANQLVVCVGDTVDFSDQTVSPISDSIDTWDFSSEGDRMFSCAEERNPSWAYTNEVGLQDVTMTVGFNGCFTSLTKTDYIEVKGAVASIDYEKFCDQNFLVDFKDSSKNANNLLWNFGDGNTSTNQHPSHTYATVGDYSVVLRAEDVGSGCAATFDTTQVYIREVEAVINIDTTICRGNLVDLDASNSTDAYENCYRGYRWLFSDNQMRPYTTQDTLVQEAFITPGLTQVQLIATDINGCRDTADRYVRVYGIESNFSINDTHICTPATVDFADLSSSDTTLSGWNWSFGDLGTSTLQNPSHTYTFIPPLPPYKRSIKLIVQDVLGCKDSLSRTITMYEPVSTPDVSDASICLGTEVNFTATDFTAGGSNLSFRWDFKDGDTSDLQNPNHTFQTAGNYTVELGIQEISTGCTNQFTQNVSVVDYPIAAYTSSADGQKYICPGTDNILFTDQTQSSVFPLNYSWDFGNGFSSSFQNPGTFYVSNGTYTITQISTIPEPYGCADTNTQTVIVKGPKGDFSTDLNGDTICRSEFVTFTLKDTSDVELFFWSFGDGDSLRNVSPVSHQYNFVPNSGQTVAKLILANSDGSCEVTQDTVIDIYEVKADFLRNNGGDTAFCFAPYPITNLSKNADSWSWDFGDGTTSDQENPGILNYSTPGIYPIQLSIRNNSLGCTDTIVKEAILYAVPELNIVGDTICEGDSAFVTSVNTDPFWTYSWLTDPSVDLSSTTTPSVSALPEISTRFFASVVDTNLCSDKDTTTVFVINPLNLNDFDTTIVVGDSIDLPIYVNAGLYNFNWVGSTEGLSCLACSPPRVQPFEKVSYQLNLEDKVGCFSYDVNFDIDVFPETFIKMPTSFSPNGDGVNDVVWVKGWGIKDLLEYKIFNRWGEIVFETTDIEKGWDGRYRGKEQNNDVYVYKIRVQTWKNEEKALEGYLNLIR